MEKFLLPAFRQTTLSRISSLLGLALLEQGTFPNSGLDTEHSEMFNPMKKLLWLGLDETATNHPRKIAISLLPKMLVTGTELHG
jgi:hypothetical protein